MQRGTSSRGGRADAAAAAGVERIAAGLQRLGLKPGDRIGLLLPNCPAYPMLFFAGLQAGLTIVNFNPLYTPRELEHQARDADCAAMATLDLAADLSEGRGAAATTVRSAG